MANLSDIDLQLESGPTSQQSARVPADIFPPEIFTKMLCLERKRCERSGRRLVLMLLEPVRPSRTGRNSDLGRIALVLSRSCRDTDIIGWHKQGSALGVLFTEISVGETSIVEILSGKVQRSLSDAFGIGILLDFRLSFHLFPDDCKKEEDSGHRDSLTLYPDLVSEIGSRRASLALKRCIDIAGSVILLVLLSPVLVLIACLVKITSPGPILFRQKRLGQFGRGFTFLKFRSMHAKTDPSIHQEYIKRFISNQAESGEDSNGQKIFKLKGDPRVTRVGAFLRRTSLDELPQLFNVLTGQMSLVGPRPPLPYEFESYEVWHRRRLFAVKPGITGYWQVEGRSRVKFDDMVRMDLQYAREWSIWLDLRILLRTPRAVLGGDGAY